VKNSGRIAGKKVKGSEKLMSAEKYGSWRGSETRQMLTVAGKEKEVCFAEYI
jgi:hypothetical protein